MFGRLFEKMVNPFTTTNHSELLNIASEEKAPSNDLIEAWIGSDEESKRGQQLQARTVQTDNRQYEEIISFKGSKPCENLPRREQCFESSVFRSVQ